MIRKRSGIFFILIICFLSLFISCKTKFDLRGEKDSVEQIVEDIKSKKIVFLGNEHANGWISLFIKENLLKFYEAGVRYVFLEGDNNHYISKAEDFCFCLYPVWGEFGFRFEETLIGDEIIKINEQHKEDPITVIFSEQGLVITEEEWEDDTLMNNIRDRFIQRRIIEIMDSTDSKALVFYGNAHGLKKSEIWNPSSKDPYWIRLGYYLDRHYGNSFSTYYFYPYDTDRNKTVLYEDRHINKLECKSLSEKNIELLLKTENAERDYDHYCLYKKWIHAVPVYYVPTNENLRFMISLFPEYKISEEKKIDIWSEKSKQLFALYYLKYHLGSRFDYDYTRSDEQLQVALEKLKNEDLNTLPYDLEQLELYSSLMTEWISSYVCDHSVAITFIDRDLDFYLEKMSEAQKQNPRDIWPQYWTAYFRTEKAIFSDKKADFQKAQDEWQKLFENDLFYASPIVKNAYRKMSLCAAKSGNQSLSKTYQTKADNVNPVLDFDFEYYQYFGW